MALPAGFFDFPEGNGWVQDLTVTIRFTFSADLNAIVFYRSLACVSNSVSSPRVSCWGRLMAGVSTTWRARRSRSRATALPAASPCRAGAEEGSFTTDRLQFVLMDADRPAENRVLFVLFQDVAMGWRFE